MNSSDLIKKQDTPKKRILEQAKAFAKVRAGIAASEKDITTRDIVGAMFVYFEQMEGVVFLQQKAIEKLITEQKEDREKIENLKIRLSAKV